MMKKLLSIIFFSIATIVVANAQVKWVTFSEAIELNKTKPKKILIDVYTDWCGYCKMMDKNTFGDTDVAKLINENFYAVKLNAESTDPVEFGGNTYTYDKKNRVHQLAVAILQGKMSYPSIAYMDESNQLLTVVPGYLKPNDLTPILKYFGENHYKTTTWDEYMKTQPAATK